MQIHKLEMSRCPSSRLLIAALAAATCGAVWADEPSPWYVGASQALTHDSNVFRVPNGPSDTYSDTSLFGGFDQPVSRQRFYAAANLHYSKYSSQSALDNTSYGVNAGWDWATIESLSGNLGASANQSLAARDNNTTQALTARNLVKTDQLSASVRWGGQGPLSLDGSYAHSRVRYSAAEALSSQSSGDSTSIGATYRLGPELRVGTALRYSHTVAPFAIPLVPNPTGPQDYESNISNGRNVDLTLNWVASAQTGLNSRLSWTRQTNTGVGSRDFSGLTGGLTGTYAPTPKLGFSASASRDAGTNASFFNYFAPTTPTNPAQSPTTVQGLSEGSQTTDSFSLGATYAATAKISLNAGLRYSRSKIVDALAAGSTTATSESSSNYRIASLGATYAIARAWQLACNASHSTQRVSGASGYSYFDNTVSCSAQFSLR